MTKLPTAPRHNPWPDYFHRAAKEEMGLMIEFEEMPRSLIENEIQLSRPEGFEDYSVATCSLPNTIFIVKPGVRLD